MDALDAAQKAELETAQAAQDALLKLMETNNTANLETMKQAFDAQTAALDLIVKNATDALAGISGTVAVAATTVAAAQAGFNTALSAMQTAHTDLNSIGEKSASTLEEAMSNFQGAMDAVRKAQADVTAAQANANSTSSALADGMKATLDILKAAGDNAQTTMTAVGLAAQAAKDALDAIKKSADAATLMANSTETIGNALAALQKLLEDRQNIQVVVNNTLQPPTPASPPTAVRSASEQAINDLYLTNLGRDAEAEGMSFYKTKLSQGYTVLDVESMIKRSPEYATKVVTDLFQEHLNRAPDVAGLEFYRDEIENQNFTAKQVEAQILASPEYMGSFDVGTNWMPGDGIAQVHEGERIVPRADNIELLKRLNAPAEAARANADLAQAIDSLKQAIKDGDIATVQTIKELLKIHKRWDGDGLPEERETEV